jgi:hypothetical protein
LFSRSALRSALGTCLTGLALLGTVGMPLTAQAKPPASKTAKQPIGVGAFVGPQGPKVRTKVLKILRDSGSYEVTDVEDVKPGASTETYQQMAHGIQAEAIVVGTVSKVPNLTITVYGANGAKIDSIQVKGGTFPKLFKAIDNEVEIAIADPLERAHAGGGKAGAAAAVAAAPAAKAASSGDEPAPKAAEKPNDDEEEAPVDDAGEPAATSSDDAASDASEAPAESESERGLRPIELSVGLRMYNRNFSYTGQTSPGLIPYDLPLAPAIWVAGRIYPGALWSNGPFSNLGIMFRYEYGIATTTKYQQPTNVAGQSVVTELQTSAYEYQVGLRGRLPIGKHELGIFGVYGNQSFVLAGDEDPTKTPYALVPDVHYHYLRFGLDARFYISKLLVGAHVAPRFLTSMKEIDKGGVWFPAATGSGLDMGVLLGWQILPWLTPTLGVDLVRYGFDFNNTPVPQNIYDQRVVAGGATDTYLSGWLGATFNFDFAGSAKNGAVSAEAAPAAEADSKSEEADEPEEKPAAKPKAEAAPPPKEAAPAPKPKAKAKGKPVEEEEEEEIE